MFHKLNCLTLVLLVALPLTADAQRHRGRARQGTQTPRAAALAPPPGLAQALLPAGARRLPTSPANAPYANWKRWPSPGRPGWNHPRFDVYPFGGYSGGGYFYPGEEERQSEAPAPVTSATNKGLVQLMITPASGLDYYIDGAYIGSSSSLGSEFEVNAGARQIEVRSSGYKAATFDTRIDEGRVTTVRGVLEPVAQPQPARSTGSRVMYVIPGCYMGNAKPERNALPPGCDVRKMVTRGTGL